MRRILLVVIVAATVFTPPAKAASAGEVDFAIRLQTPGLWAQAPWGPKAAGGVTVTSTVACTFEGSSTKHQVISDGGFCSIAATGMIGKNAAGEGAYCNEAAGTLSGTITMTGILGGIRVFSFTATFEWAGPSMVFTGNVSSNATPQSGPLLGTAKAVPGTADPFAPPCFGMAETSWTLTGVWHFSVV